MQDGIDRALARSIVAAELAGADGIARLLDFGVAKASLRRFETGPARARAASAEGAPGLDPVSRLVSSR